MFNQGVLVNNLKIAKVILIFKSGEKSFTENYRPISLLPAFCKVTEKLLKTKIISFINTQYTIYCQSDFRKKNAARYVPSC